jgi:hypothetical protein
MKIGRLGWPLLVALAPALFGSVSQSEVIHHDAGVASTSGAPPGSEGICSGVPDEVPFIANLKTGWAIAQPSSNTVRLVFSDQVIGCENDAFNTMIDAAQKACTSAWGFSFLLPAEHQTPGTFDLSTYEADYQEAMAFEASEQPRGCGPRPCGGGAFSGGTGPVGPSATVEIYSATDQCITGRLQGLPLVMSQPPPPDWDGAFHAVRCAPGSR